MEIKVNDYVRTDKGTIDKITDENIMIYQVALMGFGEKPIKSSPRIIDLIEVGDIIKKTYKTGLIEKIPINKIEDIENIKIDFKNGFKLSIVTKEQFEQMEYKINE